MIFTWLFFYSTLCFSQFEAFNRELNQLQAYYANNANLAIAIYDIDKQKYVYSKNKAKNFYPASTLKLVTAYAALEKLGKNYRFETSLWTTSQQQPINDGYKGNIILTFSADPTLTVTDLDQLIGSLKSKGIHTIHGKWLIDDTSLSDEGWSNGTVLNDTKFCFSAPISAIIINKNCIQALAQVNNNSVHLTSFDDNFVDINNHLHYSTKKSDVELTATADNVYQLNGSLIANMPLKIAVQNNRLYCKRIIEYLLNKHTISIDQGIAFEKKPKKAQVIATHYSAPLSSLLAIMLKESDNIIANALFRSLGTSSPKTWQQSSDFVQSLLIRNLHFSAGENPIYDGSGLSIYNKLTASQLIILLNRLRIIYPSFEYLLSISKIDGTLKHRMQTYPFNVFAKSGTAKGMSSLAGYITSKKNNHLAFVILLNQGLSASASYKELEDKICYLIYRLF